MISERITVGGGERPREFQLRRPRTDGPVPLIIMFHGTGGTAAWAEDESEWTELARQEGFAVAYPEGLPLRFDRPVKFLTNPPVWHDGSFGPNDFFHEKEDLRFLGAMLDLLIADHGIDPNRIFATGFSNGGGMCFALAAAMAHRLAAIAPVAGHCWLTHPQPSRPLPTYYMVGDADPLIPLAGGPVKTPWGWTREKPSVDETLRRWASALGCSADMKIVEEDADSRLERSECEPPLLKRTFFGHGHHWPGGRGKLSDRIGGTNRATIDARHEIWDFFRRSATGVPR